MRDASRVPAISVTFIFLKQSLTCRGHNTLEKWSATTGAPVCVLPVHVVSCAFALRARQIVGMPLFKARPSPAERARKANEERQLVSLQQSLPVAVHRDAQRHHWEVGIELRSGQILVCQILLPDAFPDAGPTIRITTPCSHPWLGPDGMTVVGHDQLKNWHAYYDLGRISAEVIKALTERPPTPREQPRARAPAPQARPQATQHQYQQQQQRQPQQRMPQQQQHEQRSYQQYAAPRGAADKPRANPASRGRREQHVEVPASFPAIDGANLDGLMFMKGDSEDSKTSRRLFVLVSCCMVKMSCTSFLL